MNAKIVNCNKKVRYITFRKNGKLCKKVLPPKSLTPKEQALKTVISALDEKFSVKTITNSLKEASKSRATSIRRYVRDEYNDLAGCLVAMKNNDEVKIGFSAIHNNDICFANFMSDSQSRRVSGMIAEVNAVMNPANFGLSAVPLKLQSELPSFMARCCKYFNVGQIGVDVISKNRHGYRTSRLNFVL